MQIDTDSEISQLFGHYTILKHGCITKGVYERHKTLNLEDSLQNLNLLRSKVLRRPIQDC